MTPGDSWLLAYGEIMLLAKGYDHPPGWVVVAPYKVNGARVDPAGYQLKARGIVEERLDCIGRKVMLAPINSVNPVDPVRAFQVARGSIISLHPAMKRLVEVLEDNGVVGLTGSWAYGGERQSSDVDFIIKADDTDRLVKALLGLSPRQCKQPPARLPRLNGLQLLDACVDSYKYTIRVVESLYGRPCGGMRITQIAARYRLRVFIREPITPYNVPARYLAYAAGLGEVIVETWRTRYQELAPGVYYMVADLFYDHRDGSLIASPDLGGMVWRAWSTDQ